MYRLSKLAPVYARRFGALCLSFLFALPTAAQFLIQTIAGSSFCGDGGIAVSALLIQPEGVVFDGAGNLYVADANDHRVRKVDAQGFITTLAGTGVPGFSGDGGPAGSAQLNRPYGLSLDAAGDLFIADLGNARIREVTPDGSIHTFAGGGSVSPVGAIAPVPAAHARLNSPRNVFAAPGGVLYFSDFGAQQVYMISKGLLTAVAGDGFAGYAGDGGQALSAELNYPAGLAVDSSRNLYVADSGNNCIRRVSNGIIQTVAQAPYPTGLALDQFGTPYVAGANYLGAPSLGIMNNTSANDLTLYAGSLVYSTGHLVEQMTPMGNLNVLAGSGAGTFFGDGGPAISARLNNPLGVAADGAGNIYIADTGNDRIREVRKDGVIITVAGADLNLGFPSSIASDAAGNLYIADTGNNQVEWRAPNGGFSTFLTQLKSPSAVAVDASGDVYIADRGNSRIVAVNAAGVVSTAAAVADPIALTVDSAGNLYVSDNAQNALLKIVPGSPATTVWQGSAAPGGVAVDASGNIYVSDTANARIQQITSQGSVVTIAGNGIAGFSGDGGQASSAQLMSPAGLAMDASGNLLLADAGSNRIRRLTPAPQPPPPEIGPIQVVNAASNLAGALAPGELVTIYGSGFDPSSTQVAFDASPAQLFYTGATQINALAPSTLTPGTTTNVSVASGGAPAGSLAVPVAATSPALFAAPDGQAAALNQDSSANTLSNPAKRGSIVVLYATGEGQGSSAATLWIGGAEADILFAGPAPGFVGLMQINARVPADIPTGSQPVKLIVGGTASQSGVTVAVQ